MKLNQWKNADIVIKCFKSIENKGETSFIIFDIESFYPSISPKLFNNSTDFAKSIQNISDNERKKMRLLKYLKVSGYLLP